MHHHKHEKSQHDIKHFTRMIANIEKALDTNQNLDKFVIEEKISENTEVKDHVKAHNRIIDKFKKIKHHIKKQAEHALLEFIKYGFDRTPENVWKNIMENKLKQLHPHHHEKDIREVVTMIKSGIELSSSIRNAFKNMKDSQIIGATLKLNDKIECMEKFLNGLTCLPIKNDKLQGIENVIGAATKNQLLCIFSVFQTIAEQFQKLKPYAQNHIANTFTAALPHKLVGPIDTLIKKSKAPEPDVEDVNRWKDLKLITENLANYQLEKINQNYQRLNQALVGDLKKIKAEMLASNKSSFDIYKKITDASSQFTKKVNDPKKAKERSSVLLTDVSRQIDPFLSFCNQISSLQLIKEKSKTSKYISMQSNHSILQIYFQILRDCQFDRDQRDHNKPNDNSASELKTLIDFNTLIYNLVILKKSGGYGPISFEKIQAESGRILSEIQKFINERNQYTQKKDMNIDPQRKELQSREKDNEIKSLQKKLQVLQQLYQKQVLKNEEDVMLFNTRQQNQINASFQHMKKVKELKEQLHNSQKRCFLLQEELQTQKNVVKQRQDTINRLEIKLQKYSNQDQGQKNQNHRNLRTEQHKALLAFAEQLYDELMRRFEKVPYFEKYIKQPKPANVEESIKQLNQKMQFLLKLLECYVVFAKKSKIWEMNAIMLEMTSNDQESFDQKCLQMWKSDLEQCVKTFTSRGAYMHEYKDSVISEL